MSKEENEQTRLLREILKWIRFMGMKEVKNVLNSVLKDDQDRLVYHLSDGTRGTVEIAQLAKIGSTATIAKYWQTWSKLNLGENRPVKGGSRFERSFDLADFGIDVPEVKLESPQPSIRPAPEE